MSVQEEGRSPYSSLDHVL